MKPGLLKMSALFLFWRWEYAVFPTGWAILAILLTCCLTSCKEEKEITWIGCPVVNDDAKFTPREGWISGIEIGLREDGVVVWRNKK